MDKILAGLFTNMRKYNSAFRGRKGQDDFHCELRVYAEDPGPGWDFVDTNGNPIRTGEFTEADLRMLTIELGTAVVNDEPL